MVSRSSLFVNARVHLDGTKARSAVITHRVGYIATRLGADRSPTEDDLRRSELAERMGIAGYCAARPGSTALFDEDGAVALAEARRRLASADGALATWVISARREEAPELGLGDKAGWERFARANLRPALAEAMGVPESSVRWVAAEHENAEASKHIHVISWSSDGAFDSLMGRRALDGARRSLVDSALAPAVEAELSRRDAAREEALAAVRAVGAGEIECELPPQGRVSYAHLRRFHPSSARHLEESLESIRAARPALARAEERYREAAARAAELRGMTPAGALAASRFAMEDLRSREANAMLRTLAPDRTEAPPRRRPSPAPGEGPGTARRREMALRSEVRACVTGAAAEVARDAAHSGGRIPRKCLSSCPSFTASMKRAPAAAARAVDSALAVPAPEGAGGADGEDKAAARAEAAMARALGAALGASSSGDVAGVVLEPAKVMTREMFL